MNKSINIIGAGGHAKVVIDCALLNDYSKIRVYDDNPSLVGQKCLGIEIEPLNIDDLDLSSSYFLAIGNNSARLHVSKRLPTKVKFATLTHPQSSIARGVKLGNGTLVCAGAVINPDTSTGEHAIINSNSTIEHDCIIGDFAHICPRAALAGNVKIDQGSLIGIGSSIIPGISVGSWSILGAGSALVRSIPPNSKAYGVPARIKD